MRISIQNNCFDSLKYPRLFGDNTGTTLFTCIDRDINGNFAIGGQSDSANIVSSINTPNPILVFYEPNGTIRWY